MLFSEKPLVKCDWKFNYKCFEILKHAFGQHQRQVRINCISTTKDLIY